MENLEIYEKLRAVPAEAQKAFNNGKFSGTDINPMWRIKKMTELFGACGIGWYYEVVNREMITSGNTTSAFIALKLYVKVDGEWSKPIYGEGGNNFASVNKSGVQNVSDEAYKMALTDAISNATKQLGLGADIWFEKDKTKYTANQQAQANQPQEEHITLEVQTAVNCATNADTIEQLQKVWNDWSHLQKYTAFKTAVSLRKSQLQ